MRLFFPPTKLTPVAALLSLCLSASGPAQEKPKDGELTEASYEIWRDHVLPRDWELNFRKIEWRASFWEGVLEAQEKDRPILMWAMNGHPLCNT